MNLIVDIGNTLLKLAVFDRGRLVAQRSAERLHPALLGELLDAYPVRQAIVASTRGEADEVLELLGPRVERCLEFTSQTPVPIANDYLTPETLGRDRLAAAVGAATLYPGRNVLIVDFGTALTIDLVTADNTFRGGVISPGMHTRFRSLHDYTARLPLCCATADEELLGRTTEEAISRGVMHSLTFEIEGHIARMREKIDDLQVIFTGGDAKCFVKRIKNTIFANCNLVFTGLDRILEYNASEEPHN
ncbi:type III pantothenate kinase [Alistipes sp.]|uniref:type III pantothenate kinase n=1 Tax=Alistipes sp. TaxID=1872444 RepID=UPI003AF0050E